MAKSEVERFVSKAQLGEITSFADAVAVAEATFGTILSASETLGDGFSVADKDSLIGIPFIILDFTFHEGDYGQMVVARAVTQMDQRVVIVDGSTGIRAQLEGLQGQGIRGGVMVERGLTKSTYEFTDDKGKVTPAHTFYLSA